MSSPRIDRFVALATLVVLAGATLMPPDTAWAIRLIPALAAAVLVLVTWRRPSPASGMALLVTALVATIAAGLFWQGAMAASVSALALAARFRPALGAPRLSRGRTSGLGMAVCASVTPVALVGWVVLMEPDVSDIVDAIPDHSVALLVFGAVLFAVVNALFEEWIWRAVFQTRLAALFSPAVTIGVQAVSFGVAHASGFPRGVVGVLLVTVWGAMLGILRHQTGGMLAPVAAHIVADATIAALVLFWLR